MDGDRMLAKLSKEWWSQGVQTLHADRDRGGRGRDVKALPEHDPDIEAVCADGVGRRQARHNLILFEPPIAAA
jgi:hypothetical protein